jgi:hypothetical protein
MTPTDPHTLDQELAELESALGARLSEALRSPEPAVPVPESADRAVRAHAGQRAAEISRELVRRRVRLWPVWAAAAALLLAAGAWGLVGRRLGDAPPAREPLRADVDGSGSVDIVDAYLLARRLEPSGRADPAWDLNRDGRVDRADVDAVARIAVAVTPGDR